ncbi:MAG: hypothetical protein SO471_17830 [Anaerobutyricum hallii]|uniref:hypothetical protein n=1 Tax=Anaerobutyricum hallii TaxID=39488 RepID=UPI002A8019EB|nr:hypothetical protein [Anaerobutyricum hallii]MDY4579764.1 hypothetical protein [Anaerobutyricum hallii]
MDEMATRGQEPQYPRVPSENINQGTVAIEANRAIAEAQGKLVIAKRFPRNQVDAFKNVMEACQRKGIAEKAFYSYKRGSQIVSGPTIRFAEELARCWGNIDYGIKELSHDDGKSEMQAYAWDLETNTISVQNFTNPHYREVKGERKKLTSDRDIYEVNANMGARRLRSRILAILPNDLVESAIAECKKTLEGGNGIPLIDKVKNMVNGFSRFGVSREQLEKHMGHKIEETSGAEISELVGIYNSIKEGNTKPSDWFESQMEANELSQALDEEIKKNGK